MPGRKTWSAEVQLEISFAPVFQFHGAPDFYEAMLKNLNIVFTTLFSLECILKIIAFGPLVGDIYTAALNDLNNK